MDEDVFVVKVNRICIAILLLIGALFLWIGLEYFYLGGFDDWELTEQPTWVYGAAWFFFIGCGGAVALQMFWYLFFPPTMLRIDREGISFGTGFRYTPRLFPWKHYKGVQLGVDGVLLTVAQQLMAGARIEFEPSGEIPSALITSIGIGYFMNRLTFDWRYTNRFSTTIVAETKRLAAKYASGST